MSFRCRRVYPNGQSTIEVQHTADDRDRWLEYNSTFRPGTVKFVDGELRDPGIHEHNAAVVAMAQRAADADKPVAIAEIKIMTRHLCGGWFKCPHEHCKRIYCACVSGRCRSCGMPLSQRSDLFVADPDAEIRKSGGRSELS